MSVTSLVTDPQPQHPPDPVICCPRCQYEIKLTESLAEPLIRSKEAAFRRREALIHDQEVNLKRAHDNLQSDIAKRIASERKKLEVEAQANARMLLGDELEQTRKKLQDLNEVLKVRDQKLAEAQKVQAETVRKQRQLEEKEREIDLTIESRVTDGLDKIRQSAKLEAENQLKLKVAEKDQLIGSMQRQIEELRRKSDQGSQQLQGDAMEIELHHVLSEKFEDDEVRRVPKGESGGDVLQHVRRPSGSACGTILWETKRTKSWSDTWLGKLRRDQLVAKADLSVIVTQTMPKGIDHFDLMEGVYVVSPQCIVPVASTLRAALRELAIARQASQGVETKAQLIFQYLTGSTFRQRVKAIVEMFTSMQADLQAEKRAIQKQWSKRETQLERLSESTAGMYGDLQGIAGKNLGEIEGISLFEISGPDELEFPGFCGHGIKSAKRRRGDRNVKTDANWKDSKCLRIHQGASASAQCEDHVSPARRCPERLLRLATRACVQQSSG